MKKILFLVVWLCTTVAYAQNFEGIHFIKEDVLRRHEAETHATIRARQHQHAARKLLHQDCVPGIPRAGVLHFAFEHGHAVEHGLNPLLGELFGDIDRRFDDQHRRWGAMNGESNPIIAATGAADLRGFHKDHFSVGRGRRETVHNLFEVRCARGAPGASFGGPGGEAHVLIRPFGNRLDRVRANARLAYF